MSLKSCSDMAEAIPLEPSLGLYLKPISRIKINVQLPRLNVPGQSISSWHVMEKLKETVRPDLFLYLKSLKIASNVIKFEGELETKTSCERALARLKAAGNLKVSGFAEKLQIRAAHAACSGPTRHDWEAFFRDAKGVNEMKPGERPDTIHLEEIPVRWFAESSKLPKPSEKLLQKAFGTFGKIRRLEIQKNSVAQDNTFGKTGSMHSDLMFEAYIQYEEYVEFSIAMDSLRGKKLLYKEPDGKVYSADIKVDFDRANYLSDKCIKMREAEAKKLNHTPSPDRTTNSKDDTEKNSKLISPVIGKESSMVKETQTEKTTDKNLDKKENTNNLHLEEQGKAKKEAKLLLKELLRRAEKCKRKWEEKPEKPSSECILKESTELKKSSKKLKIDPSEICADQKRNKDALSVREGNLEKPTSSKGISQVQLLKQPKESQRNSEVKQTEECLEKRVYKNKDINSVNLQKTAKKLKLSEEILMDRKKKTQPFYEVKKERASYKEDRKAKKKIKKVIEAHIDVRGNEKYTARCWKEKNIDLHKEGNKKTTNKHGNSHDKEKKESVTKLFEAEKKKREKLLQQEHILKEKLLKNLKAREEEKLRNREKLRRELAGRKLLKSVLADTNHSLYKKS